MSETIDKQIQAFDSVMRETPIQYTKEQGLRFNTGKLRYDLLEPYAIEELVKIFTKGAEKYAPNNWLKGLPWMDVVASLERHLSQFKKGEDRDQETQLLHMAHVAWNAMAIVSYYKYRPEFDNRRHEYLNRKKIGLDIDGVICDFNGAYAAKYCPDGIHSWNCHFDTKQHLEDLTKTSEFYLGLKPLCDPKKDIPFEPHCYITSRSVPQEWTEEWLFKNGFPTRPVYTLPFGASKVDLAKKVGIDIFVDDRYENFVELNNAGICTFLFDASHNQRYQVGYKRIKSLKELV